MVLRFPFRRERKRRGAERRHTNAITSAPIERVAGGSAARSICRTRRRTFRVEIRVGSRFGDARPTRKTNTQGDVWHVGAVMAAIRSTEGFPFGASDDPGIVATLSTSAQSRETIALLAMENAPLVLSPIAEIDARIDRSDRAWREWTEHLHIDGRYANVVRRSALALGLLVFKATGAIAAAATTSLPERLGCDKNYDYRYVWTRDVAYTNEAFLRVEAIGRNSTSITTCSKPRRSS